MHQVSKIDRLLFFFGIINGRQKGVNASYLQYAILAILKVISMNVVRKDENFVRDGIRLSN